ncbi:MAG: glycosyl hydrolase family 18 protein [Treponema sp.]|nr:glycosyl hydrolase family 18 protein [Treponema sp.]
MKHTVWLYIILLGLSCISCGNAPATRGQTTESAETLFHLPPEYAELPVSEFREVWAYLLAEQESYLKPGMPITDIGYFAATVNLYGQLVDIPNRKNIPPHFSGKVHLVATCDGRALSYFTLRAGRPERQALIADLLAASKDYDGLQINFENVPQRSGEDYVTFLRELRAGLDKNKMFTVALAARTRKIADDVYDYEKILPLVDRILVMAYDEHWSTSVPGPIGSMRWCKNVASHSINVIGQEKLVMGLPFYGRAWASPNHARAYYYVGIQRIARENNVTEIHREEGIPTFSYTIPVSVKAYYDDAYSLSVRMEMYREMNIDAVGFWRLGQETPAVWDVLKMRNEE